MLTAYESTVQELEAHGFQELARILRGEPEHAAPSSALPRWNLPVDYQAGNSPVRMIFAQVADGALPGTNRSYQTTFILENDSDYAATGFLKFYDDSGAPLKLTVGKLTDSSIPITVYPGGLVRLATSGTASLKTGWASIETDQPLAGTASFGIRDVHGKIYTDVGVAESLLGTSFTIFADSKNNNYTGLALVNPNETEAAELRLELMDDKGIKITETSQKLSTKGHVARFLNEFFPAVANINNFEGSLIVSSIDGKKFAGITLRLNGDQFTSLPMVAPPSAMNNTKLLVFPQIADGLLGKLKYATSIILINNTASRATGKIELFKSDGTPMLVTMGGKTAASFDFDLAVRAVTRLVTSGTGDAKVGWSRVTMDQPISGAAIFHVFDAQGQALAEVGVKSADLMTKFNLIADSIGFFDTGIAVAYPTNTTTTTSVYFELYNRDGFYVASRKESMKLAPSTHQALFMTQLFPDYASIGEFEGTIRVTSNYPIAALTLRSIDEKLTSVPVMSKVHGFAPDSAIEFAQNLAGTSTAMRWKLHLKENDLAIRSVKMALPALRLQSAGFKQGAEIGYGTLLLGGRIDDSGLMKLVVTKTEPLEFQAVANFPTLQAYNLSTLNLFSGKISNANSGGLLLEIFNVEALNSQWNEGAKIDLDFYLLPDLVLAPASPGTSVVTVDYASVSGIAYYLAPKVLRKSTQPITFVAPDTAKANISSISPVFLSVGDLATLKGTHFGSDPKIIFPMDKGATQIAYPIQIDTGSLSVIVPEGMVEGAIRVDNGSGPGNGYISRVLFGPVVDLALPGTAAGSEVPFTVTFNQKALDLPMIGFSLNFFNVDRVLSGLTGGTVVGTYKLLKDYGSYWYPSSDYDWRVGSTTADKVELYLAYKNDERDPGKGKMIVTKLPGAGSGLNFNYIPGTSPKRPYLLLYPTKIEVAFDGFPVKVPSSADRSLGIAAQIQSGPAELGGMSSAITVNIVK